jgi:hypothetical protein
MLRLDLTELIEQQIEVQLSNTLNTNIPATIVSYNPATNRAVVKPTLPKAIASGESLDSPQVVEVPVVFHASGGGIASMTFPLKPGDGVMLAVQQRSLEGWLDGNNKMPDDPRQFDLSDSVAIPGCQPSGTAGNSDDVVLKHDKSFVILKKDNVIVIGNDKASLIIDASGHITIEQTGVARAAVAGVLIDENGNMTLQANTITVVTPARSFVLEQHHHISVQPGAGQSGTPI